MAAISMPFGATADRRPPTSGELSAGFPCGELDQELFNWLAWRETLNAPWWPVLSVTTTAPPGSPTAGDRYVIPAGATGDWSGHDQKIAEWTGTNWAIIATPNGHGASLPDGRVFERVAGVYVEKLALDAQSGKWVYAADAGTANALSVTLDPAPAAYGAGMALKVLKGANANTGAVTINVNGLGAKAIKDSRGNALVADDLPASTLLSLVYDGAAFRVLRTVAADFGQQQAPFNVEKRWTNTRVSLSGGSGNGYSVTPWAPSNYVKKSATSDLLVWLVTPTLAVSFGPTTVTLSIGGTTVSVVAANNTSSESRGNSVLNDVISGLSAGSKAISVTFSRNDTQAWTAVFCPTVSDKAQLPATTAAALIIMEVEP